MELKSEALIEKETNIRNYFASRLNEFRPGEKVVRREQTYTDFAVRADLRTVDFENVIREWEFKIRADYSAIGQILTYSALAKLEFNFKRTVQSVIAAFEFPEQIRLAIEVNNLGIEMVKLPDWIINAGFVPTVTAFNDHVQIPVQSIELEKE
jgi:hypothetical protein